MTQPLPSESFEYERYVDGLRSAVTDRVLIAKALLCDLPSEIKEMVHIYGKPVKSRNPDFLAFEMERHTWQEINAAIDNARECLGTGKATIQEPL
jgi:hypothetical protein